VGVQVCACIFILGVWWEGTGGSKSRSLPLHEEKPNLGLSDMDQPIAATARLFAGGRIWKAFITAQRSP
jgi:hypothetical protein